MNAGVEESGRPQLPVTEQIVGSNPIARARIPLKFLYEWRATFKRSAQGNIDNTKFIA